MRTTRINVCDYGAIITRKIVIDSKSALHFFAKLKSFN